MEGTQLLNYVPLEPSGPAVPQIPRPKGLFDHLCFANATGHVVDQIHLQLTGNDTFNLNMGAIQPGQVGLRTENVNLGQMNYVSLDIDVANGMQFHLDTFAIHSLKDWHLGRAMAGITAAPDGSGVVPYCVLTLFPDDMSTKIYVQAVPHDAWS